MRDTPGQAQQQLERELASSDFVYDVQVAYGGLTHLSGVGVRPSIWQYIAALWDRRHFIWRETRSKVATQNSDQRLGAFWLVLRPLLDAVFYWVIFGIILQMSRNTTNFVAFIIIGVLMFQYASRCMNTATSVMRQARPMMRAFLFPRASIPVALVARETLNTFPVVAVMLVMIAVIPPHERPEWTWLWVIPIFALQTAMNLGLAFVLARAGSLLPDLAQVMSFVTRLLMYGSGVIFPIDRFLDHPTALTIVQMNPIFLLLDMYRKALIDGVVPPTAQWLSLSAWAVGLTAVGFLLFWRGEESYTRE